MESQKYHSVNNTDRFLQILFHICKLVKMSGQLSGMLDTFQDFYRCIYILDIILKVVWNWIVLIPIKKHDKKKIYSYFGFVKVSVPRSSARALPHFLQPGKGYFKEIWIKLVEFTRRHNKLKLFIVCDFVLTLICELNQGVCRAN